MSAAPEPAASLPFVDQPLKSHIGSAAKQLEPLGLRTVGDLLWHFPHRYVTAGELTDLASLRVDDTVTIAGRVDHATLRTMQSGRGYRLEVVLADHTGATMSLVFFAGARKLSALKYHERVLHSGVWGFFTGTVSEYRHQRQLAHPRYVTFDGTDALSELEALSESTRIHPVYRVTGDSLTSEKVWRCVRTLFGTMRPSDLEDPIPLEVRARLGLMGLADALRAIHLPQVNGEWSPALDRMRFEEAFVLQAELARRRVSERAKKAIPRPPRPQGLLAALDRRLPFTLTSEQLAVGEVLSTELSDDHPMLRLLQGEVGSGKTVVALRAMAQVVDAGGQAALLAPTEVLAVQHARTIRTLMGGLVEAGTLGAPPEATRLQLLTGSLSAAERRVALAEVASGQAGLVVGTHALLEDAVQFADLGLVVVDEQHRFGVEQRDVLRARGDAVRHTLVMTATPIPRTVAMTTFGDLEVSTLTRVPAGRGNVRTVVVPQDRPAWVERTWQRIAEEVHAGHRAYVVCPRISPTDSSTDSTTTRDLHSVTAVAAMLADRPDYSEVRIGILHGALPASDKEAAMNAFSRGDIDVLVATTVVEVGLDVPQATIMVVLDADRFGISQLHQLRGRIGRGPDDGLCLLVGSVAPDSPGATRLEALAATRDGFELAQVDLSLRAEGDVLGEAQSGRGSSLRVLRVVQDAEVIAQARVEAQDVVAADPQLADHQALARQIAREIAGREESLERA